MTPRKLPVYPPDHPVALALHAMFSVLATGDNLLETLADTAERAGVPFGSERFDEAAAMAGVPYCRSLDLYLDRQTQREADSLPLHLAHMALTH